MGSTKACAGFKQATLSGKGRQAGPRARRLRAKKGQGLRVQRVQRGQHLGINEAPPVSAWLVMP